MAPKAALSLLQKPSLLVFFLTLGVRLLVLSHLTDSPYFTPDEGDMKFYNSWALSILHGHWTDGKAFYGLPGYPFLIAGIYKLLGANPFYLSGLQAVAEAFISVLIFRIANLSFVSVSKPFLGLTTGLLAALGYAFFVPAQTFSVILMPTSLMVCVFWLVVWWSIRERTSTPTGLEVLGLGLLIGVTAMIVATVFFVVPLAMASLLFQPAQIHWLKKLPKTAVLALGIVIGCSPATLHNRLIAHDPVFLSAHSGLNFFIGNNAIANGYPKIPDGLRTDQAGMLSDSITIAEAALGATPEKPVKRSAVSIYWSAKASAYIQQHPKDWLLLEGQKVLNFWNAHQYDDLSLITPFSDNGLVTPGLRFGLVSALGLAGMFAAFCTFPRSRWVAAAILLHMASLLTVFITERYRLAAVPGLLIFGAFLIVRLWEAVANGQWKMTGTLGLLTLASALFVTISPPDQNMCALDAFNSGVRALKNHQVDDAEKKFLFAWRYTPGNDELNFALGNLYLEKNDNQRAKEYYRHVLEINPRHPGALNNLGYIALEQKMPAIAIRFFGQSLAVAPADATTNYRLALAYFENNQPAAALAPIHQALLLKPDVPEFLGLQTKIQALLPSTP